VDHPVDVGSDPPLVAEVERLEGAVVTGADGRNERSVLVAIGSPARCRERCSG
jgi:hypothetical protein